MEFQLVLMFSPVSMGWSVKEMVNLVMKMEYHRIQISSLVFKLALRLGQLNQFQHFHSVPAFSTFLYAIVVKSAPRRGEVQD